ncbi:MULTISPECIES: hypothetical protein [Marinobacter]|nr:MULTISPECIES: hypothetical protein [Marinobacter]
MSEKQQLHADEILIELLRNQAGTPFSNTEIRDLYLSRIPHGQRPSANQLRKHIYRELLRLEAADLIERYEGATGRGCKFIYRLEHDGAALVARSSPYLTEDKQGESTMDRETRHSLQEELSNRKVELIASIGEAEEYQRLYNKYPALRSAVKTQYLESRERSTKLLGHLRAVESVIAKIGSSA